jgi:hypothetical protein
MVPVGQPGQPPPPPMAGGHPGIARHKVDNLINGQREL